MGKNKAKKQEKKAEKKEKKAVKKEAKKSAPKKLLGIIPKKSPEKKAAKKERKKVKKAAKKANPKKGIGKKIGIGALAVATGGVSLLATKKGKQAVKNVAKKLKKVNPVNTLKKIAKGAGDVAAFTALAPFMPMMLVALKKKGVNVPKKGNAKEVASLFYANIIKKQHLEHCEHLDNYKSGEVAYNRAVALMNNGSNKEHLIEEAASGIVTAILNYFTGKKKAKENQELTDAGEEIPEENKLTEDEQEVVDEDEPITEEDTEIIEDVNDVQDGLAQEVGGEDSDGNIHVPEDEVNEELEHLINSDFERYGIMKLFNN